MGMYAANVVEVQHILKEYQVEADSISEAVDKAARGETVLDGEIQREPGEVVERVLQGPPVRMS